jgi:hypothetical protein
MIPDAEWLDKRQDFRRESPCRRKAIDRHGDVFAHGAITLTAHRMVVHASVHQAALATGACVAVEIGIAGHKHPQPAQTSIIFRHAHDLGAVFVPRIAG